MKNLQNLKMKNTFQRLGSLCFLGVLWFLLPAISYSESIEKNSIKLKIMNYNIKGVGGVIKQSKYSKIGKILAARLLDGTAPDVVAIQEAFQKNSRNIISASQYPYYAWGPRKNGFRISAGLLILSRHPIVEVNREIYDYCIGIDCFARKGYLRVVIAPKESAFRVAIVDTHLQAGYSNVFPYEHNADPIRKKQVTELSRAFELEQEPNALAVDGTVFLGDFNSSPEYESYFKFLEKSKTTDVLFQCLGFSGCLQDENLNWMAETGIDRQFISTRDGVDWLVNSVERKFNRPDQKFSDHKAVESEVEFFY